MAFFLEALLLLLTIVVVYLLYLKATSNNGYWKERGVPCPPMSLLFGTQKDLTFSRVSLVDFFRSAYESFPGSRYVGLIASNQPGFVLRDPELVKHVLTKDFEIFPGRGSPSDEKLNPLSGHLFNQEGVRWRNLRIKMTPTFTSGKIKRMFPLMQECSRELGGVLEGPATRGEEVDFRDVLGRYSTDVIGTCAFGVACNSLKDPNAEFRRHGKMIFETSSRTYIRTIVQALFPRFTLLIFWMFKNPKFEEFFLRVMKENLKFREEQQTRRDDFLDLLIELKNKGRIVDATVDLIEDPFLRTPVSTSADEFKFTETALAAQAFGFFAAGFESSSTTMSFCLLELAYHQEIQAKVQNELDAVLKKHGDFTYEALSEMTYLDKVVAETLRKYPPLAVLIRRAMKPYRVPGSQIVLEAGTRVFIPVLGLHYDPAYYPDPELFDPERFSAEMKASRHPYTYLPFGEGPRICIGLRFALLQTKLGVVSVLRNCSVEPSTTTQYPVQFKKGAVITTSANGCNLIVKERAPCPDSRSTSSTI